MKSLRGFFKSEHIKGMVNKTDLIALNSQLYEYVSGRESIVSVARECESRFKGNYFVSDETKNINARFMALKLGGYRNIFSYTYAAVENISEILGEMDKLIEGKFQDITDPEEMDFGQLSVITFLIKSLDFLTFVPRLLEYCIDQENNTLYTQSGNSSVKSHYTPGEIKDLDRDFMIFLIDAPIFVMSASKIRSDLNSIAPAKAEAIAEATSNFSKMDRVKNLNPVKMNFFGVKYGVFYHLKAFLDDMADLRYKARKEEIAMLQLKLRLLEEQRNKPGSDNARLEKSINHYSERVRVMRQKNIDFEKELEYS